MADLTWASFVDPDEPTWSAGVHRLPGSRSDGATKKRLPRHGRVRSRPPRVSTTMKIVVFGARGWIGQQLVPLLAALPGAQVLEPPADLRADDDAAVRKYLTDTVGPDDRVVSLIGRTHGPGHSTIDYLEQPGKLVENLRDNLFAPVSLACACAQLGVHFTSMGTGCIFSDGGGDEESGERYKYREADLPDFTGSGYSTAKGITDRLLGVLTATLGAPVLNVRIRMPITADLAPRNFITKITTYAKVCSVANSMTVLSTLLPILADLVLRRRTGTINLTNPGAISHNEILAMVRDIVDPTFTWTNFSLAEQDAVLASKRSNNVLDTALLESLYPDVPNVRDAVRGCLEAIARERAGRPLPAQGAQ